MPGARFAKTILSVLFWCVLFAVAKAEPPVNFIRDVKPILARRCFACHGPDVGEGGLRLHEFEAAIAELDSGAHAIVPGKLEESALIERVSSTDEFMRMPPEGKPLSEREITIFRNWIASGAKWEKHWAFVPPKPQEPPKVENSGWVVNPIDAFVLAGLEEAGLSPAPLADKRTLVRRAYFDLTGLPPTVEEIEAFERDPDPQAWEKLVDNLIASPHYGERWGRHWLDLVRYAETNSFERDGAKPNAWKYRDYVIRSFNEDKPYDQFLREQLAGDELDEVTEETITATGYYRLGTWDDEPADPEQARYDEWDNIISTTSQAMLGLTVECARCHDHKIDPIPQADYYGLLAFFADVKPYGERGDQETNSQWDLSPTVERTKRKELRSAIATIEKEKTSMEEVGIKRMPAPDQRLCETSERKKVLDERLEKYLNPSEWEQYQATLKKEKAAQKELDSLPEANMALAVASCDPRPAATHIMQRGNPHVPGDEVAPHFLQIAGGQIPKIPSTSVDAHSAGRRRILADWVASPENMFTARVIANRIWQFHFGRGIVRSSSNFGELGTPPTHPELLDWLALWLTEHDWQLKPLHRLIMNSNTYRMSSEGNEQALTVDPTNDLMWRFDMRRLSAEEVRDTMLAVTNELNRATYGPSVFPKIPQEVLNTQSVPGQGWEKSTEAEAARRSVYIHVKRSLLTPLLSSFDFPDVDSSCEARFVTVQPGQALTLLNSEFANERAWKLAERVFTEREQVDDQIARVVELALSRAATQEEIAAGQELITELQESQRLTPQEAMRVWCLTVLNLNEFVYLD
jgi:hypothetical protein